MAYEGSWEAFGRDFSPKGLEKTADVDPDPAPPTLTLEEVLEERLRQEGRLEEVQEKIAGFRLDGEVETEDVQDLAAAVEKIGAAVERREQADQALVERFEKAAVSNELINRAIQARISRPWEIGMSVAGKMSKAEKRFQVRHARTYAPTTPASARVSSSTQGQYAKPRYADPRDNPAALIRKPGPGHDIKERRDLPSAAVEKIGAAVERREQADQDLVERFEKAALLQRARTFARAVMGKKTLPVHPRAKGRTSLARPELGDTVPGSPMHDLHRTTMNPSRLGGIPTTPGQMIEDLPGYGSPFASMPRR